MGCHVGPLVEHQSFFVTHNYRSIASEYTPSVALRCVGAYDKILGFPWGRLSSIKREKELHRRSTNKRLVGHQPQGQLVQLKNIQANDRKFKNYPLRLVGA